jgi:hypothetical protein
MIRDLEEIYHEIFYVPSWYLSEGSEEIVKSLFLNKATSSSTDNLLCYVYSYHLLSRIKVPGRQIHNF